MRLSVFTLFFCTTATVLCQSTVPALTDPGNLGMNWPASSQPAADFSKLPSGRSTLNVPMSSMTVPPRLATPAPHPGLEEIPTTWPNFKLEQIPIHWPQLKILPADGGKSGMPLAPQN